MIPQPRRWSRATLPNRPLSLQETDVIEVVRQLRTAANAVAIRTPILSYCESFAIANSLRFGNRPRPKCPRGSGAADVKQAPDAIARRGGDHADHRHLEAADSPVADERQRLVGADGKKHNRAERDRHDGGSRDRDPKERHEQERYEGNQGADQRREPSDESAANHASVTHGRSMEFIAHHAVPPNPLVAADRFHR